MMAYLHCRRRTEIPTRIQTQNPTATLYCTKAVTIARTGTGTRIPIWFWILPKVKPLHMATPKGVYISTTGRARLIRSHSLARFCFELSGNSN